MTATNHALTGAVIALAIKQPVLAIPLAFISHFVIDMIPHFDAGFDFPRLAKGVVFTDSTTAGVLTIALPLLLSISIAPWILFVCMFAAISPDLVWGLRYYRFRDFKKVVTEPMSVFSRYHQKIQWSETHKGAAVEVVWLAAMISIIIKLSN